MKEAGLSAACGLCTAYFANLILKCVTDSVIQDCIAQRSEAPLEKLTNFLSSTMPLEASIALIHIVPALVVGLLSFGIMQIRNKLSEEKAEINTSQAV